MATSRTRARWLLLVLGLLVIVAIIVTIPGCAGGGFRLPGWLSGGGTVNGGAGNGVPGVRGGITHMLARLDWWIAVAGGGCILVGAYRAIRADLAGAGYAVAAGVGLFAVNAVVAALLPALIWIAVVGTGILAAVWIYTLATGRGLGGHSVMCLWRWLRTGRHQPHPEVDDG